MGGISDLEQEIAVTFRYPVRFTRGALRPSDPTLREALQGGGGRARLLVAIDAGLASCRPTIAAEVTAYCLAHGDRLDLACPPLLVPGGEAVKNGGEAVERVRAAIDAEAIDRHSYVVAIGGGAVLDAVGYAAATAHRGVRLVRLPSTVLAQLDSGVGVKNGVNRFGKKNFVGSFAPPHAVINDLELLETLGDRDWRAGISEAVKVALLKSAPFFAWIEASAAALAGRDPEAIGRLVHRCAELHLRHIATSGDPFELGSSRPLDFGHWAAHQLESLSGYELRHGEAVAIGLALDVTYAALGGALGAAERERVVALLEALGLPVWHAAMTATAGDGRPTLLDGLEEFRRHLGGELSVTLIEGIGAPFEAHEIDPALMLEAAEALRRRAGEGGLSWEPARAAAR